MHCFYLDQAQLKKQKQKQIVHSERTLNIKFKAFSSVSFTLGDFHDQLPLLTMIRNILTIFGDRRLLWQVDLTS